MIELDRLSKAYDSSLAVHDLTLDVVRGELLVLLGGSGCGKTTTLKLINRLVEPTSGTVRVAGTDTRALEGHELRRRIGYCFQEVGLFPHMTVGENVAIPLELLRWNASEREARVHELLSVLGLEPSEFVARWPHELSGGQRQRVGIARALMQEPKLMLLDEPTSALDPKISREVMGLIKTMAREFGVPCLCNIHDVHLAMEFCNKIIGLQDGVKMFDGPTERMDQAKLDEIYAMEVL
jgi:ABC-type proline/glycine betaine transport system ATPase subunit